MFSLHAPKGYIIMEKLPQHQKSSKQSFGDLNIPMGPNCRQICESAIRLGYKVLAISTPVVSTNCLPQTKSGGDGGKQAKKKRKLEERTGGILSSTAAQLANQGGVPSFEMPGWVDELLKKHNDVRILSRLTIIFTDINHLQQVVSQEGVSSYDLLAVVPTSSDALLSCIITTAFTFDIVTFDLEGPHWIQKIKLNMQKGKVAAEKDVFFELTYGPSLHGDDACENMVYLGNCLVEDICTRKFKNIVISSGAASPNELRSPKDVLGIGYLCGIDETTARIATRENVLRVINKADSRRFGKSWVAFIPDKRALETEQKQ